MRMGLLMHFAFSVVILLLTADLKQEIVASLKADSTLNGELFRYSTIAIIIILLVINRNTTAGDAPIVLD